MSRARPIEFAALDGDWLALDAEAGYCYSLNEVGGRIWQLLEQPTTVAALCAALRQQYAVDEATCRADVLAVLTQLASAGLVVIKSP